MLKLLLHYSRLNSSPSVEYLIRLVIKIFEAGNSLDDVSSFGACNNSGLARKGISKNVFCYALVLFFLSFHMKVLILTVKNLNALLRLTPMNDRIIWYQLTVILTTLLNCPIFRICFVAYFSFVQKLFLKQGVTDLTTLPATLEVGRSIFNACRDLSNNQSSIQSAAHNSVVAQL